MPRKRVWQITACGDRAIDPEGVEAAVERDGAFLQFRAKGLSEKDLTQIFILLEPKGYLEGLRLLYVSQNKLECLPTNMPVELEVVDLSCNCFASLVGFEMLANLRKLDLSRNLLRRTWGLGLNTKLRSLNLSYNRIRVVEGLESLVELNRLDLSENDLHRMSDLRALSFNAGLRSLKLQGNPLTSCKTYRVAIRHLLPALRQLDEQPFHPRKDLITGDSVIGCSGCSSYTDIHLSRRALYRSHGSVHAEGLHVAQLDMRRACGPATAAGAVVGLDVPRPVDLLQQRYTREDQGERDGEDRPRYLSVWRRPPKPLPRGWKNYEALAAQCVSAVAAAGALGVWSTPSVSARRARSAGRERPRPAGAPDTRPADKSSRIAWSCSPPSRRTYASGGSALDSARYPKSDGLSTLPPPPPPPPLLTPVDVVRLPQVEDISEISGVFSASSPSPRYRPAEEEPARKPALAHSQVHGASESSTTTWSTGAANDDTSPSESGTRCSERDGGSRPSTESQSSVENVREVVHMLRKLLVQKRQTIEFLIDSSRQPFSAEVKDTRAMKWAGVFFALGVASESLGFIGPGGTTGRPTNSMLRKRHGCTCPCCGGRGVRATPPRSGVRRDVALHARRRGGRGGGWTNRRRKDAPPVEFDKYGMPIPPKQSPKELEEAQQKWIESLAPEGGFEEFDPATVGMTGEDLYYDPLVDEAPPTSAADADVDPNDYPDWDNLQEYAGEYDGTDEPLDAPWRLKAEEVVREAITRAGFSVYDVTWNLHSLNIDVTNKDESQGSLSSDEIANLVRHVEMALWPHEQELRVLQRFHLVVGTPGAKDVLTNERQFKAFRGFEVLVKIKNPINESQPQEVRSGRLMERSPMFTILNVKGKNVSIPTEFVSEIRLPEAKHEEDDFELLGDDEWGSLFTSGKVPDMLDAEYIMPGLATVPLGNGVQMVEPLYYEAPSEDELMEDDMDDDEAYDVEGLEDVE